MNRAKFKLIKDSAVQTDSEFFSVIWDTGSWWYLESPSSAS